MRLLVCFLSFLLFITKVNGQTYADSIAEYRKHYVDELVAEPRKPIQPSQVKYITWYPADPAYCVWGKFVITPGSSPFLVQTHSGKQKPFVNGDNSDAD